MKGTQWAENKSPTSVLNGYNSNLFDNLLALKNLLKTFWPEIYFLSNYRQIVSRYNSYNYIYANKCIFGNHELSPFNLFNR